MPVVPDILYEKSREDLLPYEDARFNSLASGVPNCYYPVNDYSVYGSLLRAIAQEMARLEYDYSYDLVSGQPVYLTPPDIRRRWAAPLFVAKSYPNPAQSDRDYKAMLAALIPAYLEGATAQAIEDVILAYTNERIVVQELYKSIGDGVYDISDRNTIKIAVPATQVDPLSQIASASLLVTISENLYSAIDLAKPAHIGLSYAIVFEEDESLADLLARIADTLSIVLFEIEPAPLPPEFTQSPFVDPASPDTRLTAYGMAAGLYFAAEISSADYALLPSSDFRAEYALNPDGTYGFVAANKDDIVLVDQNGVATGEISKAAGVLAPLLDKVWSVKDDELSMYELD